jgi:hypothetical protein
MIEIAEVYTGEITPSDNYPEATIIGTEEETLYDEGRGVLLCILLYILTICIFFIIYIILK